MIPSTTSSDQISRPSFEPSACPISGESRLEEFINSITHGFGLVMSLIGLVILALYSGAQGDLGLFVCCSIFGSTMVLTYTASTIYHSAREFPMKKKLQTLDHVSIYLLIAGSYTPFTILVLEGALGWGLFTFAWGVAVLGIALKLLMSTRRPFLETLIYLAMGWAAVVAIVPLQQSLPVRGFALLIAGGIFYSVGTIFYLAKRIPYNHGIWHLFVLGGSACHFFAVYFSLISK